MNAIFNALGSKTIIGALIVIIAQALSFIGVEVGDPSMIVNDLATIFGAVMSIYGRVTVKKDIATGLHLSPTLMQRR